MAITTNLKTTNITADDELKEYLAKRLSKLEQLIDDSDTAALADVELEKYSGQNTGKIYRAEINLKLSGEYLRAESEAEAIRDAIDKIQEKMIREVRKADEKQRDQARAGAREAKQILQDADEVA